MELFRITKSEYQNDLSGMGAFHYGGRWNSPGNAMVYTGSRRSLCMLEILVHLHKPIPPPDYVISVIFIPDALAKSDLIYRVQDWQEDMRWSRECGDTWLSKKETLLLGVPSAIVPSEYNYLINPLHPAAESAKVIHVEPFQFDTRLFVNRK